MESLNGTGITYPEIELGGTKYTVKITRTAVYRMGKLGIKWRPTVERIPGTDLGRTLVAFSELVDMLHLATGFSGTHEELAELAYDKRNEAYDAIQLAWSKIQPVAQQTPESPAKKTGEAIQ